MTKNKHKVWAVAFALIILAVAFGLRLYSATFAYVDRDEATYLDAANQYANHIRDGQYSWLAWDTINYEHPAFNKILYGFTILHLPSLDKVRESDLVDNTPIEQNQAYRYVQAARMLSVAFGSLAVFCLSLFNPLAGLFLAVDTLGIKYTSEVYLEALPMLASLISVLAYGIFYRHLTGSPLNRKKAGLWLALSAITLGMTAACKYIYSVAGLAIGLHWLIEVFRKRISPKTLLLLAGWGICSLLMFFVFDPYLWVHPIQRLGETFRFHASYSSSEFVIYSGYPFWQPLAWLFSPFRTYNPVHDPVANHAFLFSIDSLIFLLAAMGLPRTFQRQPVIFYWIVIGLITLFFWETKWAQYPLIVLAPWCYSASQGLMMIVELLRNRFARNPQKS